jgi:type II secretory pathway component PulF
LSRKQEISRISLVIATLIGSGLDLLKALEITSRTTGNILLRESLKEITERIRSGRELKDAMQNLRYFPPLVSQVFSVGQKSGKLEEMLHQLSGDYDKQVVTMSNRLAVIVEPLLIVVLSVIVGFILFATLLPILEAGNVL